MRRRDDSPPERRLMTGFAAAGAILFAGTLFVGFSVRDIERNASSPILVAPSAAASAGTSG